MNIVLQATKAELIQLLCKATNSAITDFVVLKTKTADKAGDIMTPILVKMAQLLNSALVCPNTQPPPSMKIAYIKALREAASPFVPTDRNSGIMGLAEAKWAVENWVQWTSFVRTNNRLPILDGNGYGWDSMTLR
jgi:hypothetical protein